MEGLTYLNESQWDGDGGSFNVQLVGAAGDTILMRIDADTELSTMTAPAAPFNLTGIGGQFDSSEPYTEGYQIFPRYLADFEMTSNVQDILPEDAVSIYPNPAGNVLQVETDFPLLRIELYDLSGRMLIRSTETQLFLTDINPGLYSVRVVTEAGFTTRKILKK